MKFFSILSVIFAFLLYKITACLFSYSYDTGIYEIKEKMENLVYLEQKNYIDECVSNKTRRRMGLFNLYKNAHAYRSFFEVEMQLLEDDRRRLLKRGFIDCFKIVAHHRAGKYICEEYDALYGDKDVVSEYVNKEFDECKKQKNDPYINPIDFVQPEIALFAD